MNRLKFIISLITSKELVIQKMREKSTSDQIGKNNYACHDTGDYEFCTYRFIQFSRFNQYLDNPGASTGYSLTRASSASFKSLNIL